MGLIYTKIYAEKLSNDFSNLKIETSLDITKIDELKNSNNQTKNRFLYIEFDYKINYGPKVAKIHFLGNLTISLDKEKAESLLKDWKNEKKIHPLKLIIFNIILSKANIKAIQLEDELNIPPHFKMPSLKEAKKE